jgi:hypothetical protein
VSQSRPPTTLHAQIGRIKSPETPPFGKNVQSSCTLTPRSCYRRRYRTQAVHTPGRTPAARAGARADSVHSEGPAAQHHRCSRRQEPRVSAATRAPPPMAALVRLVSAALILSHHALTTAVHTRPLSSRRGTTEAPRVAAPSSLPRRSLSETPVCCGAPKVCTGPAFQGVSERQLFFVHPVPNSSGLSWYDHDMADALGDATFMCVDQSFVKTYNDTLVSSVHMRWSNAYVNYAECDDRDGGTCIFGDGNGTGVGRVNPFFWPGKGNACGFAAGTGKTGQCWTNLTGGQWFRSVLSPAATASAAAARAMRCVAWVPSLKRCACVCVRACVRAQLAEARDVPPGGRRGHERLHVVPARRWPAGQNDRVPVLVPPWAGKRVQERHPYPWDRVHL